MPQIRVTERLKSRVGSVWDLIVDVERFPQLMTTVQRIEELESRQLPDGTTEALVGWEVELEGALLRWVERETRDPVALTVTFTQVSGDLERFEGCWRIAATELEITTVTLDVDFEIGIPLLRDVLDPFAVDAIQRNSSQMLLSLGPSADAELRPSADVE